MILFQQNISLLLISVIIFSFGFSVVAMDMDKNGNMSDCPFINTAATCQMGFFEHISTFQSHFRAVPSRIFLLMALVLVLLLNLSFKTVPKNHLSQIKLKLFFKDKSRLSMFNKFLFALSDGIIQPKLYAQTYSIRPL